MSFLDLKNYRTLDLMHDHSSSSSNNPEKRVFSCNYCRRKFHSSQALEGHQNAHKLERNLAKKSRGCLISSGVQLWNQTSRSGSDGSGHVGWVQLPFMNQGHVGKREMDYCYNGETVEQNFHQLDLSLRL